MLAECGDTAEGTSLRAQRHSAVNIDAGSRVEIKADGRMTGDVKSPRILFADGARFKWSIDMDVER